MQEGCALPILPGNQWWVISVPCLCRTIQRDDIRDEFTILLTCMLLPLGSNKLGTVKKVGALKIIHEKYRAKKAADEYEQFKNSFNNALEAAPEMKAHLSKAQEDMHPLRVLNLFKAISDEVTKEAETQDEDVPRRVISIRLAEMFSFSSCRIASYWE